MSVGGRDGGTAQPPEELREGVREALAGALRADAERFGAPAARRLIAAGAAGTVGAVGAVLLLAGHPFGHHPEWHLLGFSCLWAAILVVAFALFWLRVRTPRWPLADAARTALVALGLAGVAALVSPDPHVLHAWSASRVGAWLGHVAGPLASTGVLGLAIAFPIAAAAAALSLRRLWRADGRLAFLTTATVTLLLFPGITLQCVGEPFGAWLGWLAGTVLGAGAGISVVRRLARRARRRTADRTNRGGPS